MTTSQQISSKNYNGVFFSTKKKCILLLKNAILCLFLKNVSPSKWVICFILNNSHLSMVEGIAFYSLYKSKVLIIQCKAYNFYLFTELPDKIKKKGAGYRYPILKLIFHFS